MPLDLPVPYNDPGKPRIAYQNLFRDVGATLSSSGDAAGYPYENALDENESTFWQPSASGVAWLKAVFTRPRLVNYVALHASTLAANGGSYDLQYSLDGGTTWLSAMGGAFSPGVNADPDGTPAGMPVQYRAFAPVLADHWRFWTSSPSPSFYGVISFGMDFACERGCWSGFAPPTLARTAVVTNSVTVAGRFVGRSVIRRNIASAIKLEHVSEDWVRGTWMPFVRSAEKHPFFLLWNDTQWPYEASYNWSAGDIEMPQNQDAGDLRYMSAGIKFDGNAEA